MNSDDEKLTDEESAALEAMEKSLIADFDSDKPDTLLYHYATPLAHCTG